MASMPPAPPLPGAPRSPPASPSSPAGRSGSSIRNGRRWRSGPPRSRPAGNCWRRASSASPARSAARSPASRWCWRCRSTRRFWFSALHSGSGCAPRSATCSAVSSPMAPCSRAIPRRWCRCSMPRTPIRCCTSAPTASRRC
ncbi:hypothetical protein SDC9_30629 [bioreactor metagenome]|uniref:Uncharacterized protein n=1 Tax=bioreactor metagenome TaxID=1076179 RepID=A0A644V0F8_9ZZZZ